MSLPLSVAGLALARPANRDGTTHRSTDVIEKMRALIFACGWYVQGGLLSRDGWPRARGVRGLYGLGTRVSLGAESPVLETTMMVVVDSWGSLAFAGLFAGVMG
jgi:hypothetical protein